MLSRENVIHRSAGEDRAARMKRASAEGTNDLFLKGRILGKLVLLVLIAGLLAAFVVLNQGAVVEPRVHLVFVQFQRPDLLAVLLLTSFVSAAGALLVRTALHRMSQVRDVLPRRLPEPVELEAVRTQQPAVAQTAPAS